MWLPVIENRPLITYKCHEGPRFTSISSQIPRKTDFVNYIPPTPFFHYLPLSLVFLLKFNIKLVLNEMHLVAAEVMMVNVPYLEIHGDRKSTV